MSTQFKKATKSQARAKIALTGPSGSGKTMSALLIAQGLGGRTAVIDTENHSASLYADKWDGWEYDVATIEPPYTHRKFFDLIAEAIKAGYDNLILDSASHMWAGEGGLLEQKDALDSRGGNSYTNWGSITKIHERFKSLIQNAPVNMIVTMRSKQDYVMEQNDKGKSMPKKVGLAPIQREGMEYEFTCVLDIGMDHQFVASKDRTDLFDGVISKVTADTGRAVKQWLSGGDGSTSEEVREKFLKEWTEEQKPQQQRPSNAVRQMANSPGVDAGRKPAPPPNPNLVTMADVNVLADQAQRLGLKHADMKQVILECFSKQTSLQLTRPEFEVLRDAMHGSASTAEFMANLAQLCTPTPPSAPPAAPAPAEQPQGSQS